ncbi:MAG: hypothetical protein E5Y12_13990 [Mesorhizobium sp.]|nr:MAG: hypothetical protein E5Y12_13990 [Mesorhizobium sp.]
MEDGVLLLELARNTRQPFAHQAPDEKKRLLNLLLSNCTWEDGEVRAVFDNYLVCLPKRLRRYRPSSPKGWSCPKDIQFGWGSWKLFELSGLCLSPNCGCS